MRALLVVVALVGCGSSSDDFVSPPSSFGSFDSGTPPPERFCGVLPGASCENEGQEITRCLCGTFEEQIGRLICCRDGVATVGNCQSAATAVDCQGKPLKPRADAATD